MYLKSITIKNFRKFGKNNNMVQFVEAGDYLHHLDYEKTTDDEGENQIDINIAPKTTLIVGKNNSGKTTVVDALDILLNKSKEKKFNSTDFNLAYLQNILLECKKNIDKIKEFVPEIEFNIQIGLSNENSSDILSKLYQVLEIGDTKTNECNIILKYQIIEESSFVKKIIELINDFRNNELLFDKFKKLIDDTEFKLQYYNNKGTLINNFKLSSLIELTYIKANNIREEKCLTKAFSEIVEYKYNNNKTDGNPSPLDRNIDDINKQLSTYMGDKHTETLNSTLKKFIDGQKCQILLKSELTVKNMLTNVIKYYFKEKEQEVPEDQFGLGYTNLIMIVAKILQYMEKYPNTAYNSQVNLIAIEEPETFMHPQMQELFIKNINDMISDLLNKNDKHINSQIIITTHSPHVLNSKIHTGGTFNNINYMKEVSGYASVTALEDDNIAVFTKEEKNILKSVIKKNVEESGEAELIARYNQFKFIKKHIKFKVSEVFFADAIVFVEGVCEYNLLQYYIDQNEKLNKKFISIVLIDGAHAQMYQNLINILCIPTLIITDIDIKRQANEKGEKYKDKNGNDSIGEYEQIFSLEGRFSTNATINKYLLENFINKIKINHVINKTKHKLNKNIKISYKLSNPDLSKNINYHEKDKLKITFQKDSINKVFSTSFEEAFILTNTANEKLKQILMKLKPDIFEEIESNGGIDNNSYKWQCKLSGDKASFANEILYKEMTKDLAENIFLLPQYILDGIDFLEKELGD